MAEPKHRSRMRETYEQMNSFDVVCTIGTVHFGEEGMNPYGAAFLLIAEHGAPGTYSFPMQDGTTCEVEVRHG